MAVIINDSNFDELVLGAELPVVVDFYTEWCGPCRAISPFIDQLATEHETKLLFFKVDVEKCPTISERYGIMSVPTFLFIKNGEVITSQVGTVKPTLIEKINLLL